MTELECRALLGDQEAQEKCTEKGLLLPCPFCGGDAMVEYDAIAPFEYSVCCGDCGVQRGLSEDEKVAKREWNTRPAPPIGRCGGCNHYNGLAECELLAECGGTNWFCGWFEPKEREEK